MMESDTETKQYTELTPVMLQTSQGYRTEVKVPVTPSFHESTPIRTEGANSSETLTSNYMSCSYLAVPHTSDENIAESLGVECEEGQDGNIYVENSVYNSLVALYRGLPKEMFINRILLNEASCEVKLGEMRSSLFEHIKETEDFPYGLQCMLKRRVCTRNSDSVAVKLAHDIHTLMAVLEGAEYSDMRELLSSGSGRSQRTQSTANDTIVTSDYSVEIKVLTDSVNTLKADMLHMKQTQTAVEVTRSKEINTIKSSILGLKSELTDLKAYVQTGLNKILLCSERIESEKCTGVTQLKNELKLVKDKIRDMHDSIELLQIPVSSGRVVGSRRHKARGRPKGGPKGDNLGPSTRQKSDVTSGAAGEPGYVPEVVVDSSSENNENEIELHTSYHSLSRGEDQQGQVNDETCPGWSRGSTKSNTADTPDTNLNNVGDNLSLADGDADNSARPNMNGYSDTGNRPSNFVGFRLDEDRTYRDVAMTNSVGSEQSLNNGISTETQGNRACREDNASVGSRVRPIVARVTLPSDRARNVQNDSSLEDHVYGNRSDDDDDDFVRFVKKRAKRYYLGGFMPTVTRQDIAKYVRKRGPTVTWISIWRSKRNRNNVIIRLNVEDNDRAELLESSSFWPLGVTCRPWRDRNDRTDRSANRRATSGYRCNESRRSTYGRSDIDDYNPYSPLRDGINLD